MLERTGKNGRTALGIPISALAALPVCPACYPAYAGVLSALGLGALANTTAQIALTVLLLSVALGALFYRARSRRGLGPFAVGVVATLGVVGSKFVLGFDAGTYAGVAVLVVSGVWNAWPRADVSRGTGVDSGESVRIGS